MDNKNNMGGIYFPYFITAHLPCDICEVSLKEGKNVEEKVMEIEARYYLTPEFDDDLRKIFTGKLPIVKALEVVTGFQGNMRRMVEIYEQPAQIDREVQEALARVFARVDETFSRQVTFSEIYEQWNCGSATPLGEERLCRYKEKNNIIGIPEASYKVLNVHNGLVGGYEMTVDGAEGSSYYINSLTGLVVG